MGPAVASTNTIARAVTGCIAWTCLTLCVESALGAPPQVSKPTVRKAEGLRPLSGFVANHGQWPAEVLFFARAGGIDATLTRDALVLRVVPPAPRDDRVKSPWPAPLILRLPGAGTANVEGEGVLPTEQNYLLGSDRSRWASHVPTFDHVVYTGVLPGIDLVVRIEEDSATHTERFAYDLLLAPGARLEDFVFDVEGASQPAMAGSDSLVSLTAAGLVEQKIGRAWQTVVRSSGASTSEDVAATFRVLDPAPSGHMRFGFEAPGRDPSRAFVLDPSLVWSTYVGSAGQDRLKASFVDAQGATYLTSRSPLGIPTTPGAFQSTVGSTFDVWIGKLSADGSTLLWATFLGGSEPAEEPFGLAVDHDGTVVVFGQTWSVDFPVTPNCLQPTNAGATIESDLFVTRLDPTGSSLVWSTYYGSAGHDYAEAMALFPSGDVLICGEPSSSMPPATPGAFDTVFDTGFYHSDHLLARIAADGSHVIC